MKLYRNADGKKMYPVCSWNENQHKLHNALDRAYVRAYDGDWDAWVEVEEIEHLLDAFNSSVHDGIVFATYEDSQKIKSYIWAYNARH